MIPKPPQMLFVVVLSVAALLGGCIVCDELSTITIHPDGSADLVKVQSNVHSTDTGAKADEELRLYVANFDARKDAEQARIAEVGGQIKESRWIRSERPYANMIVARLPSTASLEKMFTFHGDDGKILVEAHFTQEGTRRRFSMQVNLPSEQVSSATIEKAREDLRNSQANGLSETRFAVAGGRIVNARGFTVASDKQSALLEPRVILELLRNQSQVEGFIEWELEDR